MTRLKRKKLAEAADNESGVADIMTYADDGMVEVDEPAVQPSKIHGTLEKIVGAVEVGVGELIGSGGYYSLLLLFHVSNV